MVKTSSFLPGGLFDADGFTIWTMLFRTTPVNLATEQHPGATSPPTHSGGARYELTDRQRFGRTGAAEEPVVCP